MKEILMLHYKIRLKFDFLAKCTIVQFDILWVAKYFLFDKFLFKKAIGRIWITIRLVLIYKTFIILRF